MGEPEADESTAIEETRFALSLDAAVQETGIDNAMHLPQGHTGDRSGLIGGYKIGLICGHARLKTFHLAGKNIFFPAALSRVALRTAGLPYRRSWRGMRLEGGFETRPYSSASEV
jgi:hypothetical protein